MRVDMHVHSKYSYDCDMELDKIAKYANKMKIDGVAITDHDSMKGVQKAIDVFDDYGIICIPGVEVRRGDTDYLIYFIDDLEILKIKDISTLIDKVHERDGIIAIAHPYRYGYDLPKRDVIERIDAVEVFNPQNAVHQNIKAKELKNTLRKSTVAGSDAHNYGYIGLGTLLFDGSDIEDLRACILEDRVRVIGNYPTKIKKTIHLISKIKNMPARKKRYYLTHPLTALSKLLRK